MWVQYRECWSCASRIRFMIGVDSYKCDCGAIFQLKPKGKPIQFKAGQSVVVYHDGKHSRADTATVVKCFETNRLSKILKRHSSDLFWLLQRYNTSFLLIKLDAGKYFIATRDLKRGWYGLRENYRIVE